MIIPIRTPVGAWKRGDFSNALVAEIDSAPGRLLKIARKGSKIPFSGSGGLAEEEGATGRPYTLPPLA